MIEENLISGTHMNLTDVLSVIDILVTVIVGFLITHIVSVRDSRVRAIKDYYIEDLSGIKAEINSFYSNLYNGEFGAQEIIGWHMGIRNRVACFETAVNKAFELHLPSLSTRLFHNHKYITETEEFNAGFTKTSVEFGAITKLQIGKGEKKLYRLLDSYIYDINNSKGPDFISRKWKEYKDHYAYYRLTKKQSKIVSVLSVIKDWISSHKSRLFGFILSAVFVYAILVFANSSLSPERKECGQLETRSQDDRIESLSSNGFQYNPSVSSEVVEMPIIEDTIAVQNIKKSIENISNE